MENYCFRNKASKTCSNSPTAVQPPLNACVVSNFRRTGVRILFVIFVCFSNFLSAQNDSINIILKYGKSQIKQISFPVLEENKYSKKNFIEKNKLIIEINTLSDTIIKPDNKRIIISDYIMSKENFELVLFIPKISHEELPKYLVVKFNNRKLYHFKKKNKTNLFILKKSGSLPVQQ